MNQDAVYCTFECKLMHERTYDGLISMNYQYEYTNQVKMPFLTVLNAFIHYHRLNTVDTGLSIILCAGPSYIS